MLSPRAIDRAMDLLTLGILSFQREDLELERRGMAKAFSSRFRNIKHLAIELEAAASRRGRDVEDERFNNYLVEPADRLREMLLNEDGSVQSRHWNKSGLTFVEYMAHVDECESDVMICTDTN